MLSHIQKMTHLDPKERHTLENEALARRHARERRETERRNRFLARVEKREQRSLDAGAAQGAEATGDGAAGGGTGCRADSKTANGSEGELQQKFDAAAGFDRKTQDAGDDGIAADWREGDLQQAFDAASGFDRDPPNGDGDDGLAPDGNDGSDDDDKGPGFRPRRGKGYGYRRDSD